MRRRSFLAASAAASALAGPAVVGPALAQNTRARTLRVVPVTALFSVDTVFNTSLVTTNHGWAVYDTLFGLNRKGELKPQMAEGHTLSDDKRVYTIRLREGLKFHNGEPVRAQDAIQSLKRWAGRDRLIFSVRSSCTPQSSTNWPTVCPNVSRPAQRFRLWIASCARTGSPLWNFSPSRSLMV